MKKLALFVFLAVFISSFSACSSGDSNTGSTENDVNLTAIEKLPVKLSKETSRKLVEGKLLHIAYSALDGQALDKLQEIFPKAEVLINRDKDGPDWKAFTVNVDGLKYEVLVAEKDIYISENEVDLELLLTHFFAE